MKQKTLQTIRNKFLNKEIAKLKISKKKEIDLLQN